MDQCWKLSACSLPSASIVRAAYAPRRTVKLSVVKKSVKCSSGWGIAKSWQLRKCSKAEQLACRSASTEEQQTTESTVQQQQQQSDSKGRFSLPSGFKSKIDPVGILKGMDPLVSKPLAIFLRDRYKSYKVLKERIAEYDEDLLEFASAYEIFGMRRHMRHGIEVYEWAPGARFFAIVGDFNNWQQRANCILERYLGRDDYNHFRIFVGDQLREGEEEDELHVEYNYMSDFDRGDEYTDMDAVFKQMNDDYWEPGEDEYLKRSPEDLIMEIYDQIFNQGKGKEEEEETEKDVEEDKEDENEDDLLGDEEEPEWENADPETLMKRFGTSMENLDVVQTPDRAKENTEMKIPETNKKTKRQRKEKVDDARTRYEKFRASPEYNDHGLPPIDVIDDGTNHGDMHIVDDPVWRAKVMSKEQPLLYMYLLRKGRKAWEKKYIPGIPHMGRYREYMHTPEGPLQRIPAYATYVKPDDQGDYAAIFWDPPPDAVYKWVNESPGKPDTLRIYECHVGISGEDPRIATFKEFSVKVLPHVKKAGYNAVQLIGVQEHVDYSSVGYKVTNMYAISSRFGTPEDFKLLVDTAHGLGLLVFMDIVQSYAAPNEMVGLAAFDGANDCFLFTGKRGQHKRWQTRMFRYNEYEVIRYLLSCLKWWAVEYKIDGFHFHSVSSMLYTHNGFAEFNSGVEDYCNQYVDKDAQIYLLLANEMLHDLNPNIITIAEDATMYPGIATPIAEGGLGFDYYVNLLPSEMWAHLVDNVPEQDWSMTKIVKTLKPDESFGKALTYAENHIQSIVGGRSLAEVLLNTSRSKSGTVKNGQHIDGSSMRGVSLLKMIKLLTLTLGGSAYLTFMGNEFGHPEWVEFPRSNNSFSYVQARRQWNLLHEGGHHEHIALFDKALMESDEMHKILGCGPVSICHVDDSTKVIIYTRGRLLFAFNFHPTNFYEVYKVGVPESGQYERLLNTDQKEFGGDGSHEVLRMTATKGRIDGFEYYLSLEIPARSAQMYRLDRIWDSGR